MELRYTVGKTIKWSLILFHILFLSTSYLLVEEIAYQEIWNFSEFYELRDSFQLYLPYIYFKVSHQLDLLLGLEYQHIDLLLSYEYQSIRVYQNIFFSQMLSSSS